MKPHSWQQSAMDFHETNQLLGTCLFHDMGLGKTLTALWLARRHLARARQLGAKNPKFMVMPPKSAVGTWKKECHTNTPDIFKDMAIFPYSQITKAIKMAKFLDIRFIVMDESHYVKDPTTQRAKDLSALLKEIGSNGACFQDGRLLLLTGTPMPNHAAEYYTTWALCASRNIHEASQRLVDEKRVEEWRTAFAINKKVTFSVGAPDATGKRRKATAVKLEGVASEQMLAQLIKPIIHHRLSDDCLDLPEKVVQYIDLGLEDDKLLENADIEKPEAYMAVQEKLSRAKTPHMIDWMRDYFATTPEQITIFSMYTKPLRELAEKFPGKIVLFTGDETDGERKKNLALFQEGKVQAIGFSYHCGAESHNLQMCNRSFYHGYPWTDDKLRQAMARTRRQGQKRTTFHYIMVSGQNDRDVAEKVQTKSEANAKVAKLLMEGQVLAPVKKAVIDIDSFV